MVEPLRGGRRETDEGGGRWEGARKVAAAHAPVPFSLTFFSGKSRVKTSKTHTHDGAARSPVRRNIAPLESPWHVEGCAAAVRPASLTRPARPRISRESAP